MRSNIPEPSISAPPSMPVTIHMASSTMEQQTAKAGERNLKSPELEKTVMLMKK